MSAAQSAAARRAAQRLVGHAELRSSLTDLAERRLGRVVALGDSNTADASSWAPVLDAAFRLAGARDSVKVVNLGVGGDTTVHVLSRFEQVMAADPDLVIAMVGTNDARRHGRSTSRMLVPDEETRRNLELLRRLARKELGATTWLITPPPVLEERIRVAPRLVRELVSWRSSDVERKAALVRGLGGQIIDSRLALRGPLPALLRSDGLHLTLAAQERLARQVIARIAAATAVRAGSRP